MKKRFLAIVLAGVMVFSQSGAVLAAENSAAGNTSAEIAAEEEPVQLEEEEEADETEEPVISAQENEEEPAQEGTTETEPESVPEEENTEEIGTGSEETAGETAGSVPEETEEVADPISEETEETVGSVPEETEEVTEAMSEEAEEPAEKPSTEEEAEPVSSEIVTEVPTEETSKEAMYAAGDSTVRINDENVEHFVFDDSEWDCPVEVTWLGDGEHDLEAVIMEHDGPENANLEGACYIDERIHVDGGILAKAGITRVKIAVRLSADGIEDISSNEVELEVKGIYVERHFDIGDMSMLPGWDRFISKHYGCYVENADYPEGSDDYSLEVTDVAVSDENVVKIESDENGWKLFAENPGSSKVTLTYKDWNDTGGHTYEFYIYVGDDVYGVDVWPDSGSKNVLPGGTVAMSAQASHEQYNAQSGEYHTCTDDEMTGITYEWSLNIHQDNAREQLGNVITVTPDANDSRKAVVSFEGVPDDWHEGIDVEVLVSIKDGGEDVVDNYWLRMDESYKEMWPLQIDGDIDVGETTAITPQIRRYPGENGEEFDVLPSEEVRFETEIYDDNAYEITENSGTFTVKRKLEYGTSFRIKAFVRDDEGAFREEDSREYRLNDMGYWISIRDEQGTGDLFNDGVWNCPIEVRGLDDAAYTLIAWAEQHNGPEGADATSALRTDTEEKRLYIDGAKLNEMGISWIKVVVSAEVGGYQISDRSERDFGVREARIDRGLDLNDRSLLPGWTHWIDRKRNCYIENSEYPDGQDFELTVTNVALSDENVVKIENSDENGWNLRAENMGECTVTVTYTDWDGSEQTGSFKLYVGSDFYSVDMWTEDGSFKVLPGGTVTMYAQASHEQYDPETGEQHNCSDEEMSGITYNWVAEVVDTDNDADLNGCVAVTPDAADPRKAVVSFNNIPEECSWANIKVIVAIKENGEERARTDRWISMSREYRELWPTELYGDLDVGNMIQFTPEVREYPADNEAGYNVLSSDQVRFETEIYDDSAYTLDSFADGSFMLRRLREYRSSFRIKAFVKNENGDWEYADDREYWLNEKNYEIRYDIEGNDTIYSDGERTFALDLSGLGDVNYEIVPYVGTGELGEDGFENSLAEGEGWSYDKSAGRITFYGDELYNMDIGRIETKIAVMMGGIEVASEQRGFDVREAVYDYHGAFNDMTMLLSDGTWYMGKKGNVYVESSVFPDGAEGTYEITDLTFTSEEDEFDTRDPISLESDEDNWKITPVRNGLAQMHAVVELNVSDGATNYQADEELDFTVVVGGRRYDIWLKTSTGSDRLQTGGAITLFPETHGEGYDWQTGEHFDIDTSGYKVRYEVMCTHVDQRIVDEQYGGDLEAASARGALWDYTEDTENRAIVLQAKDNAYGLDLEVKAFLIDPETGEDCAGNSRTIFVDAMVFELALCDEDGDAPAQWKEELPPGGEFVFTPAILRSELNGETAPIGNPEDVTYTMDWNAGDGDGDPAHLQIKKANGDYLYPGDEVKAEDAPFTIKRMTPWNENLSIRAQWNDEEGNQQELWRDLSFIEVSYGGGFIKNNNRGDDHFTWYYTEESIDIKPDRAALDALAAQGYEVNTTVEIGIWDGENINSIEGYDPVAKGIFTQENGLQVSGDALAELKSALEAANGDGSARVNMRVVSVLGDVLLADDDVFTVHIVDSYREIRGLERKMGLGTEQSWQGGQAKLYIEDSGHDTGVNSYYGTGATFDITITDISIDNEADEEFLASVNEGGAWKLKAKGMTDHEIPVTFTFTGGPEGCTTCTDAITITGDIFKAELRGSGNAENVDVDILMGQTQILEPDVEHIEYKDVEGTIQETVAKLPDGKFTFRTYYEHYDEDNRIISVDKNTGEITPLRTGTTEFEVVVRIFDENDEECDSMFFPVTVHVTTIVTALIVPEDAVFYAVPGESYTSAEIGQKIAPAFKIYSMKYPDGKEYSITNFGLEPASDGTDLTFTEGETDRYATLSVAGNAAIGTVPAVLWAQSEEGPIASGRFNVVIHNHEVTNWETTKAPTVFKEGVRTGTCSICGRTITEPIAKLTPTIKVSWTAASIVKTKTKAVTVTFAAGDSITSAASSNTKVVTATISGKTVTVKAGTTAGTAKITVKLKSGKTAVLTITVPKFNCTSITAKSSYTVSTLSTINLGVKFNPVYSDNTITYTSANKKIATVTKAGVVKGIKVGKTTVTIKTNNNKTKKVTIVVKQGTTKLTTTKKSYTIIEGKTAKISATKTPAKSVDKITYTSANKKIATVTAKGVIKGIKAGKTTITVKSGTKSVKITVTVKLRTKSITTAKAAYTVKVKKTVSLGAKKVPSNSAEAITYKSSNTKIATVTAKGVVKGIKKGKVTITIKSGSVTKKVTVTVN